MLNITSHPKPMYDFEISKCLVYSICRWKDFEITLMLWRGRKKTTKKHHNIICFPSRKINGFLLTPVVVVLLPCSPTKIYDPIFVVAKMFYYQGHPEERINKAVAVLIALRFNEDSMTQVYVWPLLIRER